MPRNKYALCGLLPGPVHLLLHEYQPPAVVQQIALLTLDVHRFFDWKVGC